MSPGRLLSRGADRKKENDYGKRSDTAWRDVTTGFDGGPFESIGVG